MPTKFRKSFAVLATAAAIGGGLAVAPSAGAVESAAPQSGEVTASSCLGGALGYFQSGTTQFVPAGAYYKTTSRCNDIQIKPKANRNVMVCFKNGGCQSSYKSAKANTWTVIATNVKSGTDYQFKFSNRAQIGGSYAH